MKHYEAKDLIKDVFENAFDKEKYTRFIKNLLKDIEEKPFPKPYTGAYIPRAFNTYIQQLNRIGKFEDEEGDGIDILVVELKREHSIEYARSAQRNFVRWYLSGSRGGQMKDAALVAFHSAKSSEWRFSLIKIQYSLETKKDEFTPAKRFSFLVGEKGKSHTAQQQLVKLLKSDDIPLLSDLEESFSIESVTNEFFEKYKALVFNLEESLEHILKNNLAVKKEFDAKKINALDFSKKLMGQIVFIYFLQRKGWLGVQKGQEYGDGDRNFLRSLYVSCASSVRNSNRQDARDTKSNFFNDYLEHLFYDALNNNKRSTDFYPRFNCKIPFLNGGLFDPIGFYDWENTTINLLDDIFTNDIKTKEGDSGSGILDIFDLYNFTVNEAEPLEKEVAVDPEMLGKVFERMLDVKERKSKGAFYTPREIVHYMSQESLIHYLDTSLNVNVSYASSMGNSISMDVSSMRSNKKQDANNAIDTFMYYDPNAPVYKKQRNLPHWQQEGTAYFVTFRLYDSIPKEAAEKIKKERDLWLQKNKISDSSEIKKLSKEEKIEYYKLFSKRYDELLDNGYGSCVLKEPECKELVENALKYFDGSRYQLDEYAIQPNHVHVIVIPKENWTLSQITHSWKSYTANEINKILGKEGTLWMMESFDHIIRSAAQFEKIREYIIAQASSLGLNPKQQQNSYFDQSDSHRQDACDTVPKEDIEIFIKQGEQLIEKDSAILEGRLKESANKFQIPESIRKHAKLIDDKLRDIRVCDPAVGSGAFPVGVMTEIVKARSILFKMQNSGREPSHYDFKNHAIHHCLYGVDIDASAVEICKLRLWLSLVVDEQRIDMIEPLPNLDYKIVRGNSLINMPDNVLRDLPLEKEIEQLMEKYYEETDKQAKRNLKNEIDGKIKQLLKSAEQFTNYPIDFDFKLFFHEVFKEKGGFDVVIGNPPYIKESTNKSAFDGLRKLECYQGKMDIWYLFGSKGLDILKDYGTLSFIATNNWITNDGASKFRNKIVKQSRIVSFIDFFDYKIFQAGIQTMVFVLIKTNYPEKYFINYGKLINNQASTDTLVNFLYLNNEFQNKEYEKTKVEFTKNDFINNYIKFFPSRIGKILNIIKSSNSLFLNENEIFSTIDVMQDFVNKKHLEKLDENLKVGDGVFVISNKEKESINWNKDELKFIKPYYTTKEINRYLADEQNKYWVIYTSVMLIM